MSDAATTSDTPARARKSVNVATNDKRGNPRLAGEHAHVIRHSFRFFSYGFPARPNSHLQTACGERIDYRLLSARLSVASGIARVSISGNLWKPGKVRRGK